MAAITDWVMSLTRHGFERVYFLNGHGGNVATIEAAFAEIYAEWSFAEDRTPFALKLKNWWDLPGVHALANRQFPTGHGMHATPSEIAVTQAAYPHAIKTVPPLEPKIAPNGPIRDALDYRARFPDGRIGSDPQQATPALGQELIDASVAGLMDDVRAFAAEVQPGV
jgi:creatinine amidohydrolase/Fe(II)-dependent formamide hydrolase-like protein